MLMRQTVFNILPKSILFFFFYIPYILLSLLLIQCLLIVALYKTFVSHLVLLICMSSM